MAEIIAEKEKEQSTEIKKSTVLFVCTGNTCRSPMCAALYNHKYAGFLSHAVSAGLHSNETEISHGAVEALLSFGVKPNEENDFLNHVSTQINEKMMKTASVVVGVTSSHAMALLMQYPAYASKITSFSEDVPDPFGYDIETYKKCLEKIDVLLNEMFTENIKDENNDI